jgi:adenylosuccinate lyase
VTSRIDKQTLEEITDPFKYVGESEKIVNTVFEKFHKKKTFD